MVARTLEARLTARLIALAGAVLMAVSIAAVAATHRALDQSNTGEAIGHAVEALDAFARERNEGDSPEDSAREVIAAAEAEGVRLSIRQEGLVSGPAFLPAIASGACASVLDERGASWRACGEGDASGTRAVAGVPIAGQRSAVRVLIQDMLAVVAVAMVAMWWAVRRALHAPLHELADVVEWTAHVADVEPLAAPPRAQTIEILQLEVAFDSLVRRLLAALARERASSAHIAHELRTPLTAIVAELEGLAAQPFAPDAIGRLLGDVARFADVIDAILLLSSPDGGLTRAAGRPGDAALPIVNLADLARELAPPGAEVEAPEEALVEVDERLVRLALRNLLDNARKYGAGTRLLSVSRDGVVVRLAVVDNGPGLAPPTRERMFDRYWRASADGEGRGLGLALVHAVAQRYGGSADARSPADGRGLEVSMTLGPLVGWHAR